MVDANGAGTSVRERVLRTVRSASRRVREGIWLLPQGAVAATAAWVIPKYALTTTSERTSGRAPGPPRHPRDGRLLRHATFLLPDDHARDGILAAFERHEREVVETEHGPRTHLSRNALVSELG